MLNENITPCHGQNSIARFLDWTSLFEFKSMHTETSLLVVGSLVHCFETCVRIAAADFPQSELPRSEPLVERVAFFFVDCVLVSVFP